MRIFCNDAEAILSRISALCLGGQTVLSEKHLEEFSNHIHLVKTILKHEITLAKNLLRKQSKLPISLEFPFKKLRLIATGSCL